MATRKKASPSEQVILSISRTEATELLATLQQAEKLVNVVKQQQTQNFLGGLIKKIKKAVGKPIKSAK
jgi:hypothetical protein